MLVNKSADDLECERHPPSAVGHTPPKRLGDGSSRFRTEALAGPSSAPKKADDYREDGPAPLRQICRSVGARCRKLHGVNSESSATVAALLYLAI